MSRFFLLAIFSFAVCGVQAQVTLAWKYPDGATRKMAITNEIQQRLVLGEQPMDTRSRTDMVISQNLRKKGDGVQMAIAIESMQTSMTIPTVGELTFDSEKPDEKSDNPIVNMIQETLRATAGLKWTTDVDATGKVTAVDGFDEALQAISEDVRPAVAGQLATDYQMQVAQQEIDQLPKEALRPGDEWTREYIYRIERGQQLTFTFVYRYDGTVDRAGKPLHKITMRATDVIYSTNQGSKTPFELLDQNLRVRESSGTMHFDNESGQVVDSTSKTRLVGTLVFGAGGGELPAKFDGTFTVSTKVLRE